MTRSRCSASPPSRAAAAARPPTRCATCSIRCVALCRVRIGSLHDVSNRRAAHQDSLKAVARRLKQGGSGGGDGDDNGGGEGNGGAEPPFTMRKGKSAGGGGEAKGADLDELLWAVRCKRAWAAAFAAGGCFERRNARERDRTWLAAALSG